MQHSLQDLIQALAAVIDKARVQNTVRNDLVNQVGSTEQIAAFGTVNESIQKEANDAEELLNSIAGSDNYHDGFLNIDASSVSEEEYRTLRQRLTDLVASQKIANQSFNEILATKPGGIARVAGENNLYEQLVTDPISGREVEFGTVINRHQNVVKNANTLLRETKDVQFKDLQPSTADIEVSLNSSPDRPDPLPFDEPAPEPTPTTGEASSGGSNGGSTDAAGTPTTEEPDKPETAADEGVLNVHRPATRAQVFAQASSDPNSASTRELFRTLNALKLKTRKEGQEGIEAFGALTESGIAQPRIVAFRQENASARETIQEVNSLLESVGIRAESNTAVAEFNPANVTPEQVTQATAYIDELQGHSRALNRTFKAALESAPQTPPPEITNEFFAVADAYEGVNRAANSLETEFNDRVANDEPLNPVAPAPEVDQGAGTPAPEVEQPDPTEGGVNQEPGGEPASGEAPDGGVNQDVGGDGGPAGGGADGPADASGGSNTDPQPEVNAPPVRPEPVQPIGFIGRVNTKEISEINQQDLINTLENFRDKTRIHNNARSQVLGEIGTADKVLTTFNAKRDELSATSQEINQLLRAIDAEPQGNRWKFDRAKFTIERQERANMLLDKLISQNQELNQQFTTITTRRGVSATGPNGYNRIQVTIGGPNNQSTVRFGTVDDQYAGIGAAARNVNRAFDAAIAEHKASLVVSVGGGGGGGTTEQPPQDPIVFSSFDLNRDGSKVNSELYAGDTFDTNNDQMISESELVAGNAANHSYDITRSGNVISTSGVILNPVDNKFDLPGV